MGICLIATLFFWRFVETKGQSLEEIETMWRPV
jgi:hypothetical protein